MTQLYPQLISTTTGVLLLTAVLQVWGRSLIRSIGLLVAQGVALACLALTVGLHAGDPYAVVLASVVLVVKAVVLPWTMLRAARQVGETRERSARLNTAVELIVAAGLTLLAYTVTGTLLVSTTDPALQAVPVGISLVLLGLWQLLIRRSAITQLVGFLVLDNGIAATAFLTAGGLPLAVELGASLDVLLVVLVLGVLVVRLQETHGHVDISELKELRD